MNIITLYNFNDDLIFSQNVDDNSSIERQIGTYSTLTLSVISKDRYDIPVGSYVVHNSIKYTLYEDKKCSTKKESDDRWLYNITLFDEFKLLTHIYARSMIEEMSTSEYKSPTEFTRYGNITEHVQMVVDSMNYRYSGWQIGVIKDVDYRDFIDYANTKCFEALNSIAEKFGVELTFEFGAEGNKIINMGKDSRNVISLRYGVGGGILPGYVQDNSQTNPDISRLVVLTGDKNLNSGNSLTYMWNQWKLTPGATYTIGDNVYMVADDGLSIIRDGANKLGVEETVDLKKMSPELNLNITGIELGQKSRFSPLTYAPGFYDLLNSFIYSHKDVNKKEIYINFIDGKMAGKKCEFEIIDGEFYIIPRPFAGDNTNVIYPNLEVFPSEGDFFSIITSGEPQVSFKPHNEERWAILSLSNHVSEYTFLDRSLVTDKNLDLVNAILDSGIDNTYIHFESGKLIGHSFRFGRGITWYIADDGYAYVDGVQYWLEPIYDDNKKIIPNEFFYPQVGDKYSIQEIEIPNKFINEMPGRLLKAAAENYDSRVGMNRSYDIEIDEIFVRDNKAMFDSLQVGDYCEMADNSYSYSYKLQIFSINTVVNNPNSYALRLGSTKKRRRLIPLITPGLFDYRFDSMVSHLSNDITNINFQWRTTNNNNYQNLLNRHNRQAYVSNLANINIQGLQTSTATIDGRISDDLEPLIWKTLVPTADTNQVFEITQNSIIHDRLSTSPRIYDWTIDFSKAKVGTNVKLQINHGSINIQRNIKLRMIKELNVMPFITLSANGTFNGVEITLTEDRTVYDLILVYMKDGKVVDITKLPATATINGKPIIDNPILDSGDISWGTVNNEGTIGHEVNKKLPNTATVNDKLIIDNPILDSGDISWRTNNEQGTVGYEINKKLPDTATVNGKLLRNNPVLGASDVGAASISELEGLQTLIDGVEAQIDGAIESWFCYADPNTSGYPNNLWVTVDQKKSHIGDTYTNMNYDDKSWTWRFTGSYYGWTPITDISTLSTLHLTGLNRKVNDGNVKIFIKDASNPSPTTPYDSGDIWFTYDSDPAMPYIMRCKTARASGNFNINDWVLGAASGVTAEDMEDYVALQLAGVTDQLDGKVVAWFYRDTPTHYNYPANTWLTGEQKIFHNGDTYTDMRNAVTSYRWNNASWVRISYNSERALCDALYAAGLAKDTADGSRQTFISDSASWVPTPPYYSGDLWLRYDDNSKPELTYIMYCKNTKTIDELYAYYDWAVGNGNSVFPEDINGYVIDVLKDLEPQVDGQAVSWFYHTPPSPIGGSGTSPGIPNNGWGDKQSHVGDTYTDMASALSWRYSTNTTKSRYWWEEITDKNLLVSLYAAGQARDAADNKRRVFVSPPVRPYDVGDLWIEGLYSLGATDDQGNPIYITHVCSVANLLPVGSPYVQSDWKQIRDKFAYDKYEESMNGLAGLDGNIYPTYWQTFYASTDSGGTFYVTTNSILIDSSSTSTSQYSWYFDVGEAEIGTKINVQLLSRTPDVTRSIGICSGGRCSIIDTISIGQASSEAYNGLIITKTNYSGGYSVKYLKDGNVVDKNMILKIKNLEAAMDDIRVDISNIDNNNLDFNSYIYTYNTPDIMVTTTGTVSLISKNRYRCIGSTAIIPNTRNFNIIPSNITNRYVCIYVRSSTSDVCTTTRYKSYVNLLYNGSQRLMVTLTTPYNTSSPPTNTYTAIIIFKQNNNIEVYGKFSSSPDYSECSDTVENMILLLTL